MTPMKLCSRTKVLILSLLVVTVGPHLLAAERSTINVTGYVINAQLDPSDHTLKATAQVTFTATDTTSAAVFELHNALKVDSVTDAQKHPLDGERGPNANHQHRLTQSHEEGRERHAHFCLRGDAQRHAKRVRWKDSRWRRSAIPSVICCMPAGGSPWSAI